MVCFFSNCFIDHAEADLVFKSDTLTLPKRTNAGIVEIAMRFNALRCVVANLN